jgi:WD40 repeat protein
VNDCYLSVYLEGHQHAITSLASNDDLLISSDLIGSIIVWNSRTMSQYHCIKPIDESGIVSLALWEDCLVAGYANGMIRIFDTEHGRLTIIKNEFRDYVE